MILNKKNLLKNFFSLEILQFVNYIVPFLTLPYLSRILPIDKFGLVFFSLAFIQYFSILIDFGFDLSATREIAVNRHNSNNISNIFNSVIVIKIFLLILSVFVFSVIAMFVCKIQNNMELFIFAFLSVIGQVLNPTWFFQGIEKMIYITILNAISKFIFLILIFACIKQQSDYIFVPLLYSINSLIVGIYGFYIAKKIFNITFYIPKIKSLKKQFKYSLEFFGSRVAASIYNNTNTFCLGIIGTNAMVGYYVSVEKIYQGLKALNDPISAALYPYIANNRDINLFKKILITVMIIAFLVLSIIYINAQDIIIMLFGYEMIKSYVILRIFCIVAFLNTLSILIGFPLLGAFGHTKESNMSVIISSILHIFGLSILIILRKLNIYSIAYLVCVTISIELSIRLYAVIKNKLWLDVER